MTRQILLVEDSLTMRRMIAALLEREGFQVAQVEDGQQALETIGQVKPDLVLTDYEMPNLDGPGLCRALKASPDFRMIPIIMLTTLGEVESKVVGLDSGADDYIEKPKASKDVQEIFARIRAQLRIADLRRELADRNLQLEKAKARTDAELKLARKLQLSLMPKPPKPRGSLRFAVRYQPAHELGGDLYDFTHDNSDRLRLMIADISGHGVSSAMLSGMLKSHAAPLLHSDMPPEEALLQLDQALEAAFPEDYYCTGFALVLDEATGNFRYAGVGHPPALIVGPNGFRKLESNPGMIGFGMVTEVIGADDRLEPGESLLLYTDGLPDATNPAEEPFGAERIRSVLESEQTTTPAEILDALTKAVEQHVAPGRPFDDINLVLIQKAPDA